MIHWERYIKDFVSYLKIEKGLAENSILAYQRDVSLLAAHFTSEKSKPEQVTYEQLKTFVAHLYDLGLSARTQARFASSISTSSWMVAQWIRSRRRRVRCFRNWVTHSEKNAI
jgi:site-specific recombinase XerD